MTQLIVTQKHLDGIAKRFSDTLADINSEVADVQAMLNTANEPNVEARETLSPFIKSAERLSTAVDKLASLTVYKRWQIAMQTAMDAADPTHKTFGAVAHVLRTAMVMNAGGLSGTLVEHGPFAHAFRSTVVEQLANAIGMCDVLQASHETTEKLCADNGIDYAAVQDGDRDATTALVRVVEGISGGTVHGLRERLGLDPVPPDEEPPFVASADDAAAIADVLGLRLNRRDAQGPGQDNEGEAIRA